MARKIIGTLILILIVGIAYAFLKESRWLINHLPDHSDYSTAANNVRKPELYDLPITEPIDSIAVVKHLREMYVYHNQKLLKIYQMSLGDAPEGHKHFQGDEKTPEGLYKIDGKNPYSICHKNLGISYPNDADRKYAREHGMPCGGDIKIHGLPNGQGTIGKAHLLSDWTNGCIGVTDEEIDELYRYTNVGVPIFIMP